MEVRIRLSTIMSCFAPFPSYRWLLVKF